MNKRELVDAIADRVGGKKIAAEAVDAMLETIQTTVAKGEKVTITGFGVFEKVDRAAREARNPATGKAITMDEARTDVTVLLTFGDDAEITTPTRGADNPLRVPAATVAADTGILVSELPGKRLTAIVDETAGTARDFRTA